MKQRFVAVGIFAIGLSLSAPASAKPAAFSLGLNSGYSGIWAGPTESETGTETVKKRPWLAALETFSFNIGVWVWDRYIIPKPYAHISWQTVKENFAQGLIWDGDNLSTGFFAHPVHGAMSFKCARSLGLNFWESMAYPLGGYLMWGFFLENDEAAINDVFSTTLGGIHLGEILFRMSSRIRNDSATGGERIWREILAGILNPIGIVNRLIFGESFRTSALSPPIQAPLNGQLGLGGAFTAENSGLSDPRSGSRADLSLIYGVGESDIGSRRPFDLFVFNAGLRGGRGETFLNIDSFGLWLGKTFEGRGGSRHVLGLFQNFDYLNNEILHLSAISFTGGVFSLVPLEDQFELRTSAHLGFTALAASNNEYTMIRDRDYNYGLGGVAKADGWLRHPRFGGVHLGLSHYRLFTIGTVTAAADKTHDVLTFFRAKYDLPIWRSLGLRLDYEWVDRHLKYDGHPSRRFALSQWGAGFVVSF